MAKRLGAAAIVAGFVSIFAGLYYLLIRAGIPYQDPPVEAQIRYAIAYGTGVELLKTGAVVGMAGIVVSAISRIVERRRERDESEEETNESRP